MAHRAHDKMSGQEDPDEMLQHYEQRLREAGQFVTVQRRVILRYLVRHQTHPTAAEVARAASRGRSASLATVYNNLSLFADLDLLRAIRAPSGETHWDIRTDAHHHLTCSSCGSVSDIDQSAASVTVHDSALAKRVEHSQIWLSGKCDACS